MNALKWLWNRLFDARDFNWRSSRRANVWGEWHPRLGFGFDFNAKITLPHKADPNDTQDASWGPEFNLGFGFLWIDFGLTIPNDDHPDDEIPMLPRRCRSCGREAEPMISDRCTGCYEHEDSCTCTVVGEYNQSSGIALGPLSGLRVFGPDGNVYGEED